MSTFKYVGVLVLATTSACSDSAPVVGPTVPLPPSTIVVTGTVVDADTLQPISGATVSIVGRYNGTSDSLGKYSVTAPFATVGTPSVTFETASGYAFTRADGYDTDYRFLRTPHDVRLYRTQRVAPGTSTTVTVLGSDSLCVNNYYDDPWMAADVCRAVHLLAPADGIVTFDARTTESTAPPRLELEVISASGRPCCSERVGNPVSVDVTAGDDVRVMVMVARGTPSQSFTLTTEFTPK